MITQLYEISSPKEVQLCLDVGVDHIGILVGHGNFPREVSPSDAAMLANSFRGQAKSLRCRSQPALMKLKKWRVSSPRTFCILGPRLKNFL